MNLTNHKKYTKRAIEVGDLEFVFDDFNVFQNEIMTENFQIIGYQNLVCLFRIFVL